VEQHLAKLAALDIHSSSTSAGKCQHQQRVPLMRRFTSRVGGSTL